MRVRDRRNLHEEMVGCAQSLCHCSQMQTEEVVNLGVIYKGRKGMVKHLPPMKI